MSLSILSPWLLRSGAAALGLTLMTSTVAAKHVSFANTPGWWIGIDRGKQSCLASGPINTSGTQLFFFWSYKTSAWSVLLKNKTWSLNKGASLAVRVSVDRRFLKTDRMKVILRDVVELPVSKKSRGADARVFARFSLGSYAFFRWNNGNTTRVSLRGTKRALAALSRCAGVVANSSRNAPPGGDRYSEAPPSGGNNQPGSRPRRRSNFAMVPYREAATMARGILNEMNTGFEILPARTADTKRVEFRLANGKTGYLVASRGRTVTAKVYSGKVIASLSGYCKGRFGSTVENVPSRNGNVMRKVIGVCKSDRGVRTTTTTIMRKPAGLLIDFSIVEFVGGNRRPRAERRQERSQPTGGAFGTDRRPAKSISAYD
ncbi:MAG: hypothetical protein AAFR01_01540 [Pseudomonadota bacterium]